MTEQEKREQVIIELSDCIEILRDIDSSDCSKGDRENLHGSISSAIQDALALLKAQEPRVMTLEEALGAEECWLERKDGCVTVASIALNGQDSGGYDVDSDELNTMRSYIFHSGYYGKYWRCWNIRPTDAQREATAWEK